MRNSLRSFLGNAATAGLVVVACTPALIDLNDPRWGLQSAASVPTPPADATGGARGADTPAGFHSMLVNERFVAANLVPLRWDESLAAGAARGEGQCRARGGSFKAAFLFWMASPDARKILMAPGHTAVGVALGPDGVVVNFK